MEKPINVEVQARKNEPIEKTIKRFSKKVKKERIVEEHRERKYQENPSEVKRKLKKRRKATLDKLKAKQETN